MGKFNLQPWKLDNKDEFTKIANDILKIIEARGFEAPDKTIYGPAHVTVHEGGTATLQIKSNGRTFNYELKLYPEGMWEIIE